MGFLLPFDSVRWLETTANLSHLAAYQLGDTSIYGNYSTKVDIFRRESWSAHGCLKMGYPQNPLGKLVMNHQILGFELETAHADAGHTAPGRWIPQITLSLAWTPMSKRLHPIQLCHICLEAFDHQDVPKSGRPQVILSQWPFQEPIDWRYLPYIRPIF